MIKFVWQISYYIYPCEKVLVHTNNQVPSFARVKRLPGKRREALNYIVIDYLCYLLLFPNSSDILNNSKTDIFFFYLTDNKTHYKDLTDYKNNVTYQPLTTLRKH